MTWPRLMLVVVAVCLCATARADTFKIDSAHSTIAFKVRHMLGTAKGHFAKFKGMIEVDRERPEQSAVTVTIDSASIDTAIAKRDDHLRRELFDVAQYPEITFKSRRAKQTGANKGEIAGDALAKNPTSRWRVTTSPLKRSQFGLIFSKSAETVSMISDEVAVDIEIEAVRSK